MAFEWFSGSGTPQFWKHYTALFDEGQENASNRYVAFDLETTGPDDENDTILAIAAIGITNEEIEIGDYFEIHLTTTTNENIVEAEAIIQFIGFIKDAVLVGYNTNSAIEMLNRALRRLEVGKLKNQVMDINVLYQHYKNLSDGTRTTVNEICDTLEIEKNTRHSVSADTFTIAHIFLRLKRKMKL